MEDMKDWLFVNDEYFGESYVGTMEDFREALKDNFDIWYAEAVSDGKTQGMERDEWVEVQLHLHLRGAYEDDLSHYPRLQPAD